MTRDIHTLRTWLQIVLCVASVCATSTPVLYSFFPWRTRPIGRLFMLQAVTFAATIDLSTLFSFWHPTDILVVFWVDTIVISLIAISTLAMTILMWKMRYPTKWTSDLMVLNNKLYDLLKEAAQVWLPGLGTLYFALAGIWHLPAADEVVGSVVAIDTFLGVVLKVSTSSYNASDSKYDGFLTWENNPDGGSALRLKSVDVNALASKDGVLFKVTNQPPVPVPTPPTT